MMFEKRIIKAYKLKTFSRCDDAGVAYYFSHKDFEGLNAEPFSFKGREEQALNGAVYSYADCRSDKVVIFDHGMGGGHRSYMREIERLCRAGFAVYAYDHSGCMTSEGDGIGGFGRSLSDLDFCVRAVKASGKERISVVGHSWGAYSTLNICSLHPDIESVVAVSGFASVKRMVKQIFSGLLSPFAEKIYAIEAAANPETVECDATVSLSSYNGKALIIHSRDDGAVSFKMHFEYMREALAANPNIRFFAVNGKKHNPNYTEAAVLQLNSYLAELARKLKRKELDTEEKKKSFVASFDWHKMTEQDEAVWEEIIGTIQ